MRKVSIFAGSVYGNAQQVAEEVQIMLESEGVDAEVFADPSVSDFTDAEAVLVVTSTTGQGDVPPNLELFYDDLKAQLPPMGQKAFAVAALGDSSYADSFCGAGKQFFKLLTTLEGKPVADLLEVDAIETLSPEDEVTPWVKTLVSALAKD
ncbi:flavodoxin [Agaribacter marinus]|uniref:Flavodoxin n=1 Tax=Agaribacter marinus TaxID=1431249 RepID=A0AA37T316_9ALTE|nr:flavodoxin [Agaribacter marinus]GLR70840.1 flavodoxin [Agaribacter marinus]